MPLESSFTSLIERIRKGDAEAAAQLVKRYEKEILRVIRTHLNDARLRRAFDSMDVCQSMLGNFFERASNGEFDLEDPKKVLALLTRMARNKLLDKVREQQAACRDQRRLQAGSDAVLAGVAATTETPSAIVSGQELLERGLALLSPEERQMADWRIQGKKWSEVASLMQGNPESLRRQYYRAMVRVAEELGLRMRVDEKLEGSGTAQA